MYFNTFTDGPKVVLSPHSGSFIAHQSHNFTCKATGYPDPTVIMTFYTVSLYKDITFYDQLDHWLSPSVKATTYAIRQYWPCNERNSTSIVYVIFDE